MAGFVESTGAGPSHRTRTVLAGMALVTILSIVVYVPTMKHGFVHWDDDDYVVENTHVQKGLTWESLRWAVTSTDASNWHPFTWLSHELDCQLFGLRPAGHHTTSVLLHALNGLLIFFLLQKATGRMMRSLLVAVLWAVHPLAVESVSWVAERKNVLSMLLCLLTLLAYGYYVRRPSFVRYLPVAILFGLALAAKPMVIMLPLLLLIIDFWPLQRISHQGLPSVSGELVGISFGRAVVEKVPLFLLSVGSAALTLIAQNRALQSLDQYPLDVRLANGIWAYVGYLKHLVWPAGLAVLYPHPGASLSTGLVLFALALLVCVTGLVWRFRGSRPYLLAGWLWYLVSLIPVIGIVQVGLQAMADRYMYLPMVGLLVCTVWIIGDLTERRVRPLPLWALALVIAGCLATATWRQQQTWSDDYHLWSHALAVTENNYIAERNVGAELVARGNPDEAFRHFERAIQFNPGDWAAHLDLGAIFLSHGQLEPAIRELSLASQLSADRRSRFTAYQDLAVAFVRRGDAALARDSFQEARQTAPDLFERLIVDYQNHLRQSPSADNYFWLAILESQAGQRSAAETLWQRALALKPEYLSMQEFFNAVAGS